jgi:TolB protein
MLLDRRLLLGGALAAAATTARAQAPGGGGDAEITVAGARQAPIPIAIPSLGAGIGDQITGVINDDLANCGLFRPLGAAASASSGATPDFATFKQLGARAVVTGNASGSAAGVVVQIRLWDVNSGTQLQGTQYTSGAGGWRRVAHKIADAIYERMLGESGYFDTRIAYVELTGGRGNQTTRLAIMDQDGANNRTLTSGQWLVHSPRFSPVANQVVYLDYANQRPRVYLLDIGSGRQRMLGDFEGISFAPRFAPSGGSVILSATRGAGSDIFSVGLGGGGQRQLTNSGAIDTSPCYSPDGSQIVFVSDRGGAPQLYIMGAGGGGARRISYGSGQYGSPVWSPRGDLIAFVRLGGGGFSLGVMQPDGSGERILDQGFTIDSPTFCPNGRVLAYCVQTSSGSSGEGFSSRIAQIDIAGFNGRTIRTPTGASDPAWSPLGR